MSESIGYDQKSGQAMNSFETRGFRPIKELTPLNKVCHLFFVSLGGFLHCCSIYQGSREPISGLLRVFPAGRASSCTKLQRRVAAHRVGR